MGECLSAGRGLGRTTGVIPHNLVRDGRLTEVSPGRGGALRFIGFLSGSFVADVQYKLSFAWGLRAIAMVAQNF
jgi:hypothetical protein